MTTASLVFAAAVAAWGPVGPAPAPAGEAVPAPSRGSEAPGVFLPSSSPPPPAPGRPTVALQPAILAKAPIDARARPVLAASPARAARERRPLYKRWQFWAIAGGLLTTAIVVTVAETRPGPQPYTGNTFPFLISFP